MLDFQKGAEDLYVWEWTMKLFIFIKMHTAVYKISEGLSLEAFIRGKTTDTDF